MATPKRAKTRSRTAVRPRGKGTGASASAPLVYPFGAAHGVGDASMRELLGGKGANLAEMARIGVSVPPGFTISTEACRHAMAHDGAFPRALRTEIAQALTGLEREMERGFGDPERPLLLSVRSGAQVSMPGMMDTVLNLGLNPRTVEGLVRESGDARFAWDCYRRFLQMFGDVVLGIKTDRNGMDPFEAKIEAMKAERGVESDLELTADDLGELAQQFRYLIRRRLRTPVPDDPREQLDRAVGAVFRSWSNPRAATYRRLHAIPHEWGTAVNVQAMVFGNLGDDCATGVAFTRDPSTGAKGLYGEFLLNAQGEDVVAGIRTPQQITLEASRQDARRRGVPERTRARRSPSLEETMPRCHRELDRVARRLERHFRDMQDIEFTIERGRLWLLQTRTGKRTVPAAVKVAVDMASERVIDRRAAVMRVEPNDLTQLLHPQLDRSAPLDRLAEGLPASPGAVSGEIVFSAEAAAAAAEKGRKTILVRIETSADDIEGMHAAQGILTARGGMTSHAAVVARGMGKCCITGCAALRISYDRAEFEVGDRTLREGDWITLDGATGEVFAGNVPTVSRELGREFGVFMRWADGFRRLGVRANADAPDDAALARHFGAEGIGLCRTEHMFFDPDRIQVVREMILARDADARARALSRLLPMQKGDFLGLLRTMEGKPVTIRLLDPPLHEFLPHDEKEIASVASDLGVSRAEIRRARDNLVEANPMLGFRGARLGVVYPEIYEMQVRAIVDATCELLSEGTRAAPEIMVPLIAFESELVLLRALVQRVVREAAARRNMRLRIPIGTMIELPRAALTADEIARKADFFSFGTNDLTQTTLGLSRDDAGQFLPRYVERGLTPADPFAVLDEAGVGALVRLGVERGRGVRPRLKIGICGEHGGEPSSIDFAHRAGLDYVSCSPFRVPIARLAAAHAAIREDAAVS